MDVVFGHADRLLVLNRGELIAEGAPAEVRAREDVRARLSRRRRACGGRAVSAPVQARRLRAERRLRPGARPVRRRARTSRAGEAVGADRAQRRRQVDDASRHPRPYQEPQRRRSVFDGENISTLPTHEIVRRGLGYVPEDRRIFSDLTAQENLERRPQPRRAPARRPGRLERLFAIFPNLARIARSRRRAHVGRRTADARHRAHADGQPLAAAARRAVRRAWRRGSSSR